MLNVVWTTGSVPDEFDVNHRSARGARSAKTTILVYYDLVVGGGGLIKIGAQYAADQVQRVIEGQGTDSTDSAASDYAVRGRVGKWTGDMSSAAQSKFRGETGRRRLAN